MLSITYNHKHYAGFTISSKRDIVGYSKLLMFEKNTRSNTDGFVLRRRNGSSGQRLGIDDVNLPEQFLNRPLSSRPNQESEKLKPISQAESGLSNSARPRSSLALADVLSQLPGDDLLPPAVPKKRRLRLSKKVFKRLIMVIFLIALIIGGYVGGKFIIAGGRVFGGNIFSALLSDGKELQKDQYGRVNILIFGTSEDDKGHEGADLADSIIIASINPIDKSGFLVSVPRDLWVKYGQACSSGYEGRVNAVYQCGKGNNNDEDGGAMLLKNVIAKNFGLDINYYAHVNYTALRQAVDAVGGITVNIKSNDPRGILDRNFDWQCRYKCYYVKYPNGPAKLNGEQALALARARNASGGYGLSGGNFDREQYQQKILVALKDKAASGGVLANPVAVTKLIDSLGNNVRTNFDAGEIKSLVKLTQEVNSAQLKRISLIDEKNPLVTTGNISGQSIVRPVAGVYDFSKIKAVIKAQLSGDGVLLESATIDVLNGSGIAGAAQTKADELEAQGYSIGAVGNAPAGEYRGIKLYDLTGGKKQATKAKLQQQLAVGSVGTAETLPDSVTTEADFVIIIGINGSN